jgi:hypothetical protein
VVHRDPSAAHLRLDTRGQPAAAAAGWRRSTHTTHTPCDGLRDQLEDASLGGVISWAEGNSLTLTLSSFLLRGYVLLGVQLVLGRLLGIEKEELASSLLLAVLPRVLLVHTRTEVHWIPP